MSLYDKIKKFFQ